MLLIQYLEGGRSWHHLSDEDARRVLRAAFDRIGVDALALGWGLPARLVEACAEEALNVGAALYRWHVLAAGDGDLVPRPDWRVEGVDGQPVPGHAGAVDFTFICPNKPAARTAVLDHLHANLADGPWNGVMFDRMRLPSPASDPGTYLGCFCAECHRVAASQGLDLAEERTRVLETVRTAEGAKQFARELVSNATAGPFEPLLSFRCRSVTQLVAAAAEVARGQGLRVGLDCFAPTLARMVGQDLPALQFCADWTKVMTYGHVLGPAGMAFELLGMADWLVARGVPDDHATRVLAEATGLPLPATRSELRAAGLAPAALLEESRRARAAVEGVVVAGIELVELPAVCELTAPQIAADARALREGGVDGLALSWDLAHMPIERLDLVR